LLMALAMLLATASAYPQSNGSGATQQVVLLAPQLITFAGSGGNLDSLVTGLTTGAPVTLVTFAADGSLQIVTFVPSTRLSPLDAARILEAARQNLIVRGIPNPSGDQIAAALLGGTISTPSGTTAIAGLLTGSTVSPTPVHVRTGTAFVPGSGLSANLTRAELQAIRNALATGSGLTLVNTVPGGQNVALPPTGLRMSELEVTQSLHLATALLAQQGILDPTAEQLRIALFGGSIISAGGRAELLQGVLQGRVRNTSDSPNLNTSASPNVNTSASPFFGTSDSRTTDPVATPGPSTSSTVSRGIAPGRIPPAGASAGGGVPRPAAR
jgi:hypothetical protein